VVGFPTSLQFRWLFPKEGPIFPSYHDLSVRPFFPEQPRLPFFARSLPIRDDLSRYHPLPSSASLESKSVPLAQVFSLSLSSPGSFLRLFLPGGWLFHTTVIRNGRRDKGNDMDRFRVPRLCCGKFGTPSPRFFEFNTFRLYTDLFFKVPPPTPPSYLQLEFFRLIFRVCGLSSSHSPLFPNSRVWLWVCPMASRWL